MASAGPPTPERKPSVLFVLSVLLVVGTLLRIAVLALLGRCLERRQTRAVPAGVVVHHGAFPGALIIGDDQSLLHAPTLLGVVVRGG